MDLQKPRDAIKSLPRSCTSTPPLTPYPIQQSVWARNNISYRFYHSHTTNYFHEWSYRYTGCYFSGKSGEPDETHSDKTPYPTQCISVKSKIRCVKGMCVGKYFSNKHNISPDIVTTSHLNGNKENVCQCVAQSHISIVMHSQNSLY